MYNKVFISMRKRYGQSNSIYEDFFEQPVMLRDRIYSIFNINGFRLGLFAYEEVKEPHIWNQLCAKY